MPKFSCFIQDCAFEVVEQDTKIQKILLNTIMKDKRPPVTAIDGVRGGNGKSAGGQIKAKTQLSVRD